MKFKTMVLSVIISIVALIVCFLVLPWGILALGSLITPNPQTPKITRGEFPFELVCEVDSEKISVMDTLVIEHKGVEWNEGSGKHNTWDTCLLNSTVELHESNNKILLKEGSNDDVGLYKISFYLGSCEYYMGIEEKMVSLSVLNDIYPGNFMINSTYYTGPIDEETLYEKYNIKIIKKSISEPLADNVK